MDRLASYAQREAESESPEQRKKTEEESISQLLEQMRIAKEKKAVEPEPSPAQQNGDAPETDGAEESAASSTTAVSVADTETTETEAETDGQVEAIEKRRGIPNNVKLFEIFHEQVQTLVKMQRLPIQDTIGLLVSLANLAL